MREVFMPETCAMVYLCLARSVMYDQMFYKSVFPWQCFQASLMFAVEDNMSTVIFSTQVFLSDTLKIRLLENQLTSCNY
jgi:hypothetical protein